MKRHYRLTRTADFKRVRLLGKSFAHPLVILILTRNSLPHNRYGITTSRALAGAVQRNRAKRRLRSWVDRYSEKLESGWDIVLIVRAPIQQASFNDIGKALQNVFARAEVLSAGDERRRGSES
ncbi:MAG: ribonuclease P protein component [Anaerolineaceae bacterium]|nr:ribonuclease P protein component [Anaerolineaceae bacterium]